MATQGTSRVVYSSEVQESLDFIEQFCKGGPPVSGSGSVARQHGQPQPSSGRPPNSYYSPSPAAPRSTLYPSEESRRVALAAEINNQRVPNTATPMMPSDFSRLSEAQLNNTASYSPGRNTRPAPTMHMQSAPADPLPQPGGPGGSVPRQVQREPSIPGPTRMQPAEFNTPMQPRVAVTNMDRRVHDPQPTPSTREQRPASIPAQQRPQQQPQSLPEPQVERVPRSPQFGQRAQIPEPVPVAQPEESHEAKLEGMLRYLKRRYAQEDGEEEQGLHSLSDDDVYALASCFYAEVFDLVRTLRMAEGGEPPQELERIDVPRPNPVPTAPLVQASQGYAQPPAPPAPASDAQGIREPIRQTPSTGTPADDRLVPPSSAPPSDLRGSGTRSSARTRDDGQQPGMAPLQPVERPIRVPTPQPEPTRVPPQVQPQPEAPIVPRRSYTKEAALLRMRQGAQMIKFGRNGKAQYRFVKVENRKTIVDPSGSAQEVVLPHLCWRSSPSGSSSAEFSLLKLAGIGFGGGSGKFKRNSDGFIVGLNNEVLNENWCFTLTFPDRTVEMCAHSEDDFEVWAGGLEQVLEDYRRQAMPR